MHKGDRMKKLFVLLVLAVSLVGCSEIKPQQKDLDMAVEEVSVKVPCVKQGPKMCIQDYSMPQSR